MKDKRYTSSEPPDLPVHDDEALRASYAEVKKLRDKVEERERQARRRRSLNRRRIPKDQ
jgi:hypothetical protein